MVIREPEFLPSDYNSLLGLGAYEATVGPCGYSHEYLMDPDQHSYVPAHTRRCPACAAGVIAARQLHANDEAFESKHEGATAESLRPSDGVAPHARLLDPSEVEAARAFQDRRTVQGAVVSTNTPATGSGPPRLGGRPARG